MKSLSQEQIDRVIEMAWEDRTPFEAIKFQFELTEDDVITIMRREMEVEKLRNVEKESSR